MNDQYKKAGVDIAAGADLVDRIRDAVQATHGPEVRGSYGGYGALYSLERLGAPDRLLVTGTDGVGTKLLLTRETGSWGLIGQDLVAMCANDILCLGARPLFFLDYYATGALEVEPASQVIRGIAAACQQIGCALVGGETAEMPGLYGAGDFDLAGFIVGWVDAAHVIDGRGIVPGNRVLGLSSSGFHANGYSLVRRLLADHALDLAAVIPDIPKTEQTLGQLLTTPTRLYGPILEPLLGHAGFHGLAHITGGGLLGNLPRILPDHCRLRLDRSRWERPPIISYFETLGDLPPAEMVRTFNDGIGMVLIVAAAAGDEIRQTLEAAGETIWELGTLEERVTEAPQVELI